MSVNNERLEINSRPEDESDNTSSLEDLSKKLQLSSYDTGPEFVSDKDRQLWEKIVTESIKDDWESMTEIERHNTWNYVRAQIKVRDGQIQEARQILSDLDETTGFRDYEDKYLGTLKSIDINITGRTPRREKGLTPF